MLVFTYSTTTTMKISNISSSQALSSSRIMRVTRGCTHVHPEGTRVLGGLGPVVQKTISTNPGLGF